MTEHLNVILIVHAMIARQTIHKLSSLAGLKTTDSTAVIISIIETLPAAHLGDERRWVADAKQSQSMDMFTFLYLLKGITLLSRAKAKTGPLLTDAKKE
jgi:hypothetical protein